MMFVKKNKKIFFFIMVQLFALVVLSLNATKSPLWYDEAIEYWYSKVITGNVPGDYGIVGMYSRIISTYQPPLYNWLMYLWLSVFDSEFLFRFAGIVTTLVGSIGIYLSIDKVDNWKSATATMAAYIFSFGCLYYTLECAEYNLLLCCVCWMIFFLVKFFDDYRASSLAGLFVFSILAAYSHYGAAFFIIGVFGVLTVKIIVEKRYKLLCTEVIMGLITIVFAVYPLLKYFLIPQISTHVLSLETVHYPDSNIFVSFISGIVYTISFCFCSATLFAIPIGLVSVVSLVSIIILLIKKDKKLLEYVLIFLLTYITYWLACIFKYYSYTDYVDVPFGNRYGLFMLPFIVFICSYACSKMYTFFNDNRSKVIAILYKIMVVCFALLGCLFVFDIDMKDNVRDISEKWFDEEAYNCITLVHIYDDANFQFYVQHNKDYSNEMQSNILTLNKRCQSATKDTYLEIIPDSVYDETVIYYVGPKLPIGSYIDGKLVISEIMEEHGYKTTELSMEGEKNTLLKFERD